MSTATLDPEELQDQTRATVQLTQAERMTMGNHIRQKLRMGRERLADHWKQGKPGNEDDMQILARDINFPTQVAAKTNSKWPLAIAGMFGPAALAAIVMAPTIIDAINGRPKPEPPPVVQQPIQDPQDWKLGVQVSDRP